MSHKTREACFHADLTNDEELANHEKCCYHTEPEESKVGLDDVFPGEDIDYKQNDCKEPELAERCPAEIWLGRKSEGGSCKQHEQKQWRCNWRKPESAARDEPLNGKGENGAGQKY